MICDVNFVSDLSDGLIEITIIYERLSSDRFMFNPVLIDNFFFFWMYLALPLLTYACGASLTWYYYSFFRRGASYILILSCSQEFLKSFILWRRN